MNQPTQSLDLERYDFEQWEVIDDGDFGPEDY